MPLALMKEFVGASSAALREPAPNDESSFLLLEFKKRMK